MSQFFAPGAAASRRTGRPPIERPDQIIGQRVRLRMMIALANAPSLTFTQLLEVAATNCGSMSQHARRLERFGYVTIRKGFVGRTPQTDYQLTPQGRLELATYLDRHPS